MASLAYLRSTVRPLGTSISTAYGSTARFTALSFSTSAQRQALKETDRHRDDLPNKYEEEKNENLKNVKEGKAYWREQLASESEASVKADRGEASIPGEEDFLAKNKATATGTGAQGTQGTQQGKK